MNKNKVEELQKTFEQAVKNLTEAFEGLKAEIINVDEPEYKTVKRAAKVGERILITNPDDDSVGTVGEVFTVTSACLGDVDVEEIRSYASHFAFRAHEYEVIIPEQLPFVEEEPVKKLTPNQQRGELIERAKEFEEVQKNNTGNMTKRRGYDSPIDNIHLCDADFKVNDEKRTVVCLLRGQIGGQVITRGIAKCMPGEVFNEHIGKAIALARALEIDVPEEFLNAVQPSVAKGQVVKATHVEVPKLLNQTFSITSMIPEFDSDVHGIAFSHTYDNGWLGSRQITIINDTNAEYEVTNQ